MVVGGSAPSDATLPVTPMRNPLLWGSTTFGSAQTLPSLPGNDDMELGGASPRSGYHLNPQLSISAPSRTRSPIKNLLSGFFGSTKNNTVHEHTSPSLKSRRSSTSPRITPVLLYKGLRNSPLSWCPTYLLAGTSLVRMGIHSGLDDEISTQMNTSTGRVQYGGQFLSVAKAIGDVAAGGMILASQATYAAVSWATLGGNMAVVAAGQHMVKMSFTATPAAQTLYQVVPHSLAFRAVASVGQIRSMVVSQPGFQSAPCGKVAVAYLHAVGVPSLMVWNPEVTNTSLSLMSEIATALLNPFNGYLLDCSENLGVLASFGSAADAIKWALVTEQALLQASWPEELLDHPLGEEICTDATSGPASDSNTRHVLDCCSAENSNEPPFRVTPATRHTSPGSISQQRELQQARGSLCGNSSALALNHDDLLQPDCTACIAGQSDDMTGGAGTQYICPAVQGGISVAHISFKDGDFLGASAWHVFCGSPQQRQPETVCSGKAYTVEGPQDEGINEISARIAMFGKVMNRAARVTGVVRTNQVWCTAEAWDHSIETSQQFMPLSDSQIMPLPADNNFGSAVLSVPLPSIPSPALLPTWNSLPLAPNPVTLAVRSRPIAQRLNPTPEQVVPKDEDLAVIDIPITSSASCLTGRPCQQSRLGVIAPSGNSFSADQGSTSNPAAAAAAVPDRLGGPLTPAVCLGSATLSKCPSMENNGPTAFMVSRQSLGIGSKTGSPVAAVKASDLPLAGNGFMRPSTCASYGDVGSQQGSTAAQGGRSQDVVNALMTAKVMKPRLLLGSSLGMVKLKSLVSHWQS